MQCAKNANIMLLFYINLVRYYYYITDNYKYSFYKFTENLLFAIQLIWSFCSDEISQNNTFHFYIIIFETSIFVAFAGCVNEAYYYPFASLLLLFYLLLLFFVYNKFSFSLFFFLLFFFLCVDFQSKKIHFY